MKAILEFNLPDEENDFKLATRGRDYWLCLWDLLYGNNSIRGKLKYGHDFKTPDEVLEWVRDFIEDNVNLGEIE